jgi:hypothetical protein
MNREGQEGQGGEFTGEASELASTCPAMIEESRENLGQLLVALGFRDEVVPRATDTLAAAQGADGEVAEDEDQDMVWEDDHLAPLVGGLLLRLD